MHMRVAEPFTDRAERLEATEAPTVPPMSPPVQCGRCACPLTDLPLDGDCPDCGKTYTLAALIRNAGNRKRQADSNDWRSMLVYGPLLLRRDPQQPGSLMVDIAGAFAGFGVLAALGTVAWIVMALMS